MRKYWIAVFFISASVYAQLNWIDFSQEYLKLSVEQEGIYRVSYEDIDGLGYNLSAIDPRRLRLYYRGEEVAIRVSGSENGRFDPGDFFEFYGFPNDGAQELSMYTDLPPQNISPVYTNKSHFFLTWSIGGPFGRRIVSYQQNNVNNLPVETFCVSDTIIRYYDNYHGGKIYPEGANEPATRFSYIEKGEGWTSTIIQKRSNQSSATAAYEITGLTFLQGTSFTPRLEAMVAARNNQVHVYDILAGASEAGLTVLGEATFENQDWNLSEFNMSQNQFANDRIWLGINVKGTGTSAVDAISPSYFRISYPRSFSFDKPSTFILDGTGDKFIQFSPPASGAALWDVSDRLNPISIQWNSNTSSTVIRQVAAENRFIISDKRLTPVVQGVSFSEPDAATYVIIVPGELNSAILSEYAQYRASPSGGNYEVEVWEAEDVYNIFNYGESGPVGIKALCDYYTGNFQTSYFFLIGKGLLPGQRPVDGFDNTLPTYGSPGSDLLYVEQEGVLQAAIGRLSVTSTADIQHYLNKVKEVENTPPALWRKRGVHLSGGVTESELRLFSIYLSQFEAIAESQSMGGKIETIFKNSTEVVKPINIVSQVNEGLNIITFFGHSGVNVTDIDIGFASDETYGYTNKGEYPIILLNGCEGGNIFLNRLSFGEDWIRVANKGAIAVIGHSYYGYPLQLRRWSRRFYERQFGDTATINLPIGRIHQELHNEYIQTFNGDIDQALFQQFILQGDPAVKIFPADKPDYELRPSLVSIGSNDNNPLNALSDSIRLQLIIPNNGIALPSSDSIGISVIRRALPQGNVISSDTLYVAEPPAYIDTISFAIANPVPGQGFGLNSFEVRLDPADLTDELNENNNVAFQEYVIPSTVTINLHPASQSLVAPEPELRWQTTNPFEQELLFEVEIDTTPLFNSPFLQQQIISSRYLAEWLPDYIGAIENVVYYWRTRQQGDDNWTLSSFSVANQKTGWSWRSNEQIASFTEVTNISNVNGIWDFNDITVALEAIADTVPYSNGTALQVELNGDPILYPAAIGSDVCFNNSLILTTFRKEDLVPEPKSAGRLCGRRPRLFNSLTTSDHITTYMNQVDTGDWVLGITQGTVSFSSWTAEAENMLQSLGLPSDFPNAIADGLPVVFLGRRGDAAGSAILTIGTAPSDVISFTENIVDKTKSALLRSGPIGPAYALDSILISFDNVDDDEIEISLYNYDEDTPFFTAINGQRANISSISPGADKLFYLEARVTDESLPDFPSAPRVDLTYLPVPESMLFIPDDIFASLPDTTISQGVVYQDSLELINVSGYPYLDSLSIITETGTTSDTLRLLPLSFKSSVPLRYDTRDGGAPRDLTFRLINPDRESVNNRVQLDNYLIVDNDELNPFVQVRVDGRLLLDGDIVAASPLIEISLRDENTSLRLDDTTYVSVFIKGSCETCIFRRIPYTSGEISWDFRESSSELVINYMPENLENDIYTLRVQSSDVAGNESGNPPYEINFEVVNESTLTNVYPYPNPFSDNVRFIFTLTGNQLPDEFSIRIFTIGGRQVRLITRDMLGPINIGNNITTYAWDGRDEFGDQLANGVYLYRVDASIEGEPIEVRPTAGDRSFTNGFGKLYLLR